MVVFAGRGAVGTLGAVGRQPVCHRRRPESRCSSFLLFFFFAFLSFPSGLFSPLQGHGASLFYKERIFLAGISRLIWKYFFLFIICIFSSPHQQSLCVWNVYWNLSYSIAVYYSKTFLLQANRIVCCSNTCVFSFCLGWWEAITQQFVLQSNPSALISQEK